MQYKKLLLGVDFSNPCHDALRTATEIAHRDAADLVLVHVSRPIIPVGPDVMVSVEDCDHIELHLAEWQHEAERAGAPRVRHAVVNGTPWQGLVEVMRGASFDLAVVGTRGGVGLRHLLWGSTIDQIVRYAPCPVLVVRSYGDAELRDVA
jgi:nucleotide-binding universal stress UspA family protein